ncbi:MAG: class I SAM-dependent methyltransferase [Christensenella sp.]|nr:class I SAM-dependent methyltransferase [Christensenella sp.]
MNWFEERSKTTYNELAAGYDDSLEGEYTVQFKALLLNAVMIQPDNNILDVACGNGRLLNMLAKQNRFNGYGVDIAEKMIEYAKQLNPDMQFSVGNCENIPLPDQTMDVITVCAAYHHFPHVDLFARESFRLMKAGGRIYIAEVYYPSAIRLLTNPFLPLLKKGDVKIYAPDAITSTLKKAGFQDTKYSIHGHIQIVSARK